MITLEEAKEILAKEYHIDNFTYLIKELLLPDFVGDKHDVSVSSEIFTSVKQLGDSAACNLSVFEVVLQDGAQNRRVAITQEMFKILRGLRINNAVVAFANADKHNFRISLLTSKYEYDGEKIVKVLSNPRRYSYSLGIGTKTKTAYKFLIAKGKVADLNELINRFSVEVVNKQFYSEIATSFTELVGGERDGKTYEKLLNLHGTVDHNMYAEFGVRLIGRIMFCWFLREKRSENNIPLVPDDMLALETINGKANYYHDILEPLFFELLNTPHKKRKDCFDTNYYKLIPYLNGGLFSPHTDDRYKFDPINNCGQYGVVTIPNEWFIKLYNTLGQYNFTVDENTAYDIELSIDPEMLGRIFENLLAEINPETGENAKKSTGSFYTPRDIVDYMVDSSLCEYLKTKTGIDEIKLNALISYSKDDDDLAVFDKAEKKQLIDALYTVTVLDPACGSGAFPIGMLQKVVYVLQEIDPDANLWFDKATENVGILLKKEFEKKFNAGSLNYIRKLSVIQNSIFGIDIQPIAVEISRLRCFLSLIIEEKVDDTEENRGINPLPNLDFKFIIANSLITLDNTTQLSIFENQDHIKILKDIREEYFNADSERRTELKLEFLQVQQDMLLNTIANYQKQASARYQQLSEWKPFENQATSWFDPEWMFGIKDGFDIVIGNPPYVQIKQISWDDRRRYEKIFHSAVGRFNLFYLFIEKAALLEKKNGLTSFIVPDRIMLNTQCEKLRSWLLNEQRIIEITSFGSAVFADAIVDSVIMIYQNTQELYYSVFCRDRILPNELVSARGQKIDKHYFLNSINKQFSLTFDPTVENLIAKIKSHSIELNKIAEIKDGIIQGKVEDLLFLTKPKDSNSKPILFGRNINRYIISYDNNWVNYVPDEMMKEEIIRRGPGVRIGLWMRTPEIFERDKILTRQTADEIIAAYDCDNYYYANTLHGTTIIDDNYNPRYVLAVLNSKITTWFYRTTTAEGGKVFAQIKIGILGLLPIPKLLPKEQEEIVEKVDQIMILKKQGLPTIELEKDIDQLMYKIFELTPEEIALVEESIK